MGSVLIGHTGTVGSNLASQVDGLELVNSKNIETVYGRKFDVVYMAAGDARKWYAEKNPAAFSNSLEALKSSLFRLECEKMVLFSTVDVLGGDAVDEFHPQVRRGLSHYGAAKLSFEGDISNRFRKCSIIRLPALFGEGLKKNVIYDVVNGKVAGPHHPQSTYQWFDLSWLGDVTNFAVTHDINILHAAVEPMSVETLNLYMDNKIPMDESIKAFTYDMKSGHTAFPSFRDGYLYQQAAVIKSLKRHYG